METSKNVRRRAEKAAKTSSAPRNRDGKAAAGIEQEAVVLNISFHQPLFRKPVKTDDVVDDGTDTEYIRVHKNLIDRKALADIASVARGFRNAWLPRFTLPCRLVRAGSYLIPLQLAKTVDQKIQETVREFNECVETFCQNYEMHKRNAKKALNSGTRKHYDEADYPPVEEVRARFYVDYDFTPVPHVPGTLAREDRRMLERETEKREMKLNKAVDEVKLALRASYAQMVGYFTERLGINKKTGKPNLLFEPSFAKNLNEFFDTLGARLATIGGDPELEELSKTTRRLLSGVSVDQLREDEGFRTRLKKEFDKVAAAANKAVIKAGGRKVSIGQDV